MTKTRHTVSEKSEQFQQFQIDYLSKLQYMNLVFLIGSKWFLETGCWGGVLQFYKEYWYCESNALSLIQWYLYISYTVQYSKIMYAQIPD
jgi:hypothetical protein